MPAAGPGKTMAMLPMLLGLALLAGLAVALLSGDGDAQGNLTPVSP
jgi:hypothetical protein